MLLYGVPTDKVALDSGQTARATSCVWKGTEHLCPSRPWPVQCVDSPSRLEQIVNQVQGYEASGTRDESHA